MDELVQVVPKEHGGIPVREIFGEVDASNVDEVFAQLLDGLGPEYPGVVVDLRATSYLDSAGVRMLFDLTRRLRSHRQDVRLVVDTSGPVRRVLALTALDGIVPTHTDVPAAAAGLQPPR